MSPFIVWIDHDHSKAFSLAPSNPEDQAAPLSAHTHRVDHHTHALDNLDREKRTHKMFQETAKLLDDAEHVLIVGPGLAKHLFNNYLAEHFPKVFRKVSGCEALDHPTDPQIRAFGEDFFRKLPTA